MKTHFTMTYTLDDLGRDRWTLADGTIIELMTSRVFCSPRRAQYETQVMGSAELEASLPGCGWRTYPDRETAVTGHAEWRDAIGTWVGQQTQEVA
jgi:hypothetical protein